MTIIVYGKPKIRKMKNTNWSIYFYDGLLINVNFFLTIKIIIK